MNQDEFASSRGPEFLRAAAEARAKRTDRQVLNDIEARVVRTETKVSYLMERAGLNPDGTPKRSTPSWESAPLGPDRPF